MPTVLERLPGVRAKIERAEDHIRDLESRIRVFRETNPYSIVCEHDAQAGQLLVRARILRPMPVDFSTVAGDAAHNLRSSLDHLAWQLVEAGGGTPDDMTAFPIYKRPPKDKGKFARKIKGMCSDAISKVEALQPHASGTLALWVLSELDNFDKHRLLYVIACGFVSCGFHYRNPALIAQFPGLEDSIRAFTADFPGALPTPVTGGIPILEDNAEVFRLAWTDGPPINVNDDFEFTYSISFAKPEVAETWAVVPLLSQLAQYVRAVSEEFESCF